MTLFKYRIKVGDLSLEVARQLFEAWVQTLAAERLGVAQRSSGVSPTGRTATFGDPVRKYFSINMNGLLVTLVQVAGLEIGAVQSIIRKAGRKVAAGDYGPGVAYRVDMTVKGAEEFLFDGTHFSRVLNDQVHIEGSYRLSSHVLLDFEVAAEGRHAGTPFASRSKLGVTIFAPGPCDSELSGRFAGGAAEIVAAVCALATGRPVEHHAPLFAASPDEATRGFERRTAPTIPGLARDHISLDVFDEFPQRGGLEAALRMRGALLAYHAALGQGNADVAVMLLVTCVEALISPTPSWRGRRVTKRFIDALTQLCPDEVDAALSRAQIVPAFRFRKPGRIDKQRERLLSAVYDARSSSTHSGLGLPPLVLDFGNLQAVRVAVVSGLARAAVLSFLKAPRSFLTGHPGADPDATSAC